MSSPSRASSKQKNNPKPDFEGNLADFDAEFLFFVVESDPNFDVTLLRNNPTPALPAGPVSPPVVEQFYPANKDELARTIKIKGPETINSDIFADQVMLGDDVRIKGKVYGVRQVQVGANCVIEGDLVSDGSIAMKQNCRVEGSLIGADVELEGPLTVEGPVYSRGVLLCRGSLKASSLTAGGNIVLTGAEDDKVTLEASLMLARRGEIQLSLPLQLAGQPVNLAHQKFYMTRSDEQLRLSRVPFEQISEQSALLTTLTDSELEKLVADLAVLE